MAECTTKQARKDFSTLVNRAAFGGHRIVLTRRGKRVAALVSMADLEHLERPAGASADTLAVMRAKESLRWAPSNTTNPEPPRAAEKEK